MKVYLESSRKSKRKSARRSAGGAGTGTPRGMGLTKTESAIRESRGPFAEWLMTFAANQRKNVWPVTIGSGVINTATGLCLDFTSLAGMKAEMYAHVRSQAVLSIPIGTKSMEVYFGDLDVRSFSFDPVRRKLSITTFGGATIALYFDQFGNA